MDDVGTQPMYPRLVRRSRPALFDTVVFVLLIFGWMLSLPAMVDFDLPVKVAPLVIAFCILEPGLVAFTGGPLGHHFMGLRVRDATHDRYTGFFRAMVRETLRNLFGWLSFVFVFVFVTSWRGRLPGCRRVPAPTPVAGSPDLPL